MHPSEQFQPETNNSPSYGMYTGTTRTESPSSANPSQAYEQPYSNYASGEWHAAEGMAGPQYQQQMYAQPVFVYLTPAPSNGLSSEERIPAVLSYTLGWFSGLIALFFGWQNRFIRFHALQSIFFFGAVNVFDFIALRLLTSGWHHFHIWGLSMFIILMLVNAIAAIAWIVGMVQAGLGKYYQFPLVGSTVMRKFFTPIPPTK
jgi:uncharacterized membrane protein